MSRAVSSDEVMDIFAVAGLDRPNIGILSDEFLEEVKLMSQRNLAVELLESHLKNEISFVRSSIGKAQWIQSSDDCG